MSFGEALAIVSGTSLARLVIPRWMYRLPIRRLRDMETAYTSLDAHMKVLVATGRAELNLATETTARALNTAIGFLALYEDIHEEVYNEIRDVLSDNRKLASASLETISLSIGRDVAETVVLKTDEKYGHGGQIILKPGTKFTVDLVGLRIGRKFALTEAVAFLSNLLHDWRLQIVLNPGETKPSGAHES
ncbi:hypothetical protein B0H10DRAFT_1954858 [Mycena sp. CBHHK59/15]|nr:hypothetical protein B0H10DRAFT_1954858 [Mycena sp. CBHHK59/15]